MRITTLGTSHGDATYCRFSSSTLVETGGALYLVDAGAPADALLVRAGKKPKSLRAVFVTHMHEDHASGLPSLYKALTKGPGPEGQCTRIFLPDSRVLPALEAWVRALRLRWPSPLVAFDAVREGSFYTDELIRVAAAGNRHIQDEHGTLSFSFRWEAEGKRVIFTGDLRSDFSDFPRWAREEPCDLCVCEATHYAPEAALPVLKDCPIRRLVLNHVHNPWHGEGEALLRAHYATLPYPVAVAHDGDVFEL